MFHGSLKLTFNFQRRNTIGHGGSTTNKLLSLTYTPFTASTA